MIGSATQTMAYIWVRAAKMKKEKETKPNLSSWNWCNMVVLSRLRNALWDWHAIYLLIEHIM